ncbi:MAG: hypothetical protein HC790_03175 [Acaryochloridaceae cyanobacterium CSU_3_4]|nr:hypothetical protein [Acaryochloridaceae cyanobacterium CSU_3_4]
MTRSNFRIPENLVSDVLKEAIRLQAETTEGYSFEELKRACEDIQVPAQMLRKAIKNIEDKRLQDQIKRERWRY